MRAVTDDLPFHIVFFCRMIKKYLFGAAAACFFYGTLAAQVPQQADMDSIIKKIPVVPPTVSELHAEFTIHTKYGDKFGDAEKLNPVYIEIKHLVAAIHDAAIRERMKKSRREDMPDSTQYEDERWKLALRPMLNNSVLAGIPNLAPAIKEKISTIVEMQKIFDWQIFYNEEARIDKPFREKIAAIEQEPGLQMAQKKLDTQKECFKLQRDLWIKSYHKYCQGVSRLQQLLRDLNYGMDLTPTQKKIAIPILADVQARALESIEKLVWAEFSMVIKAELMYQAEDVLKFYQQH
jgi:hypothetical protein